MDLFEVVINQQDGGGKEQQSEEPWASMGASSLAQI